MSLLQCPQRLRHPEGPPRRSCHCPALYKQGKLRRLADSCGARPRWRLDPERWLLIHQGPSNVSLGSGRSPCPHSRDRTSHTLRHRGPWGVSPQGMRVMAAPQGLVGSRVTLKVCVFFTSVCFLSPVYPCFFKGWPLGPHSLPHNGGSSLTPVVMMRGHRGSAGAGNGPQTVLNP